MSTKTGVIFGRVRSKAKGTAKAGTGWEYLLHNGATMCLKQDILLLGKWYFFEVTMDPMKNMHYVSHHMLETASSEEIDAVIRTMKTSAHEVEQMWRKLEATDRQILMREAGIGLSALGSASAAWGGLTGIATALAEESLLGALTGGASLVVSAGLAGFSYLQYEERKDALKAKTKMITRFRVIRKVLVNEMSKVMPIEYRVLDVYDPQVKAIVTRLKLILKDFDVADFMANSDEDWEFRTQPAAA